MTVVKNIEEIKKVIRDFIKGFEGQELTPIFVALKRYTTQTGLSLV
ncbi:hypothetical protein LCL96_01385 [Rossellomorea aquimaris]|nr:hypothetical protein [Rossellomorea aquimaris]MCA1057568.1 hypothetical protein [Rossellomorea aquimaris]